MDPLTSVEPTAANHPAARIGEPAAANHPAARIGEPTAANQLTARTDTANQSVPCFQWQLHSIVFHHGNAVTVYVNSTYKCTKHSIKQCNKPLATSPATSPATSAAGKLFTVFSVPYAQFIPQSVMCAGGSFMRVHVCLSATQLLGVVLSRTNVFLPIVLCITCLE